jgi:PAS domain S-box-containing protein
VPDRDSQGRVVRFVGSCADIEPLKRAQEDLQESETRLQAFGQNSPNPIFLKDRQGRYLYANKEFNRALRITEDQIKGKTDDELFSTEQATAFQGNDRKVFEARVPMEFEELALQEDGLHTSIVQKFPLETIPMKQTWHGHSAFRIDSGAANILIDPFLSDYLSRDNGWSGYLTGKNSIQGGDL